MRRQWAATEAQTFGRGGVSAVSSATGMSRNTIRKGLVELAVRKKHPRAPVAARLRKEGGGRKRLSETDSGLVQALDRLIEPSTRGDPMSPLRWTCKSTMNLAEELTRAEHPVGARTVGAMLKQSGYSLQANRKTREGSSHPDRNAQFEYINRQVMAFQKRQQPVISVDTKKKELVGEFKNRRRGMAAQGPAGRGEGSRLSRQETGQGDSLRGVRPGLQRGLGERGHRSRHRRVRVREHPPLVERDGGSSAFRGRPNC